MEANKRLIFFFVAFFALLLLWQKLFPPPAPSRPEGPNPPAADSPPPASPPAFKPPDPASAEPAMAAVPPQPTAPPVRTVIVESPLYRAVVSSDGGRLVEFHLKQFRAAREADSPPFNLIPDPAARVMVDSLAVAGTELLAGRSYRYDGPESIRLDADTEKAELRLAQSFDGPSGPAVVTKTWIFYRDRYDVDLRLEGQGFAGIPESTLAWTWSDRIPRVRRSLFGGGVDENGHLVGMFTMTEPVIYADGSMERIPIKDLDQPFEAEGPVEWMGFTRDYFFSAVIPLGRTPLKAAATGDPEHGLAIWRLARSVSGDFSQEFRMYLGPRDREILEAEGHHLSRVLDQVFLSGFTRPIVFLLSKLLRFFHNCAVPNYGVAIILLTLFIKAMLFPLTRKSMVSMKAMRKIQPEMQALREKHKDDPQRFNAEMMGLYKRTGVNPLSGCLPVLVQLPIFIALYTTIVVSIHLRHAPFLLWIGDLSQPEHLFYIAGFPFRLLPLLMGISMIMSQKMTPMTGVDPMQQRILNLMPIVFTVVSWQFPAGLVLYWIVNNLLQIVQQQIINRSPRFRTA